MRPLIIIAVLFCTTSFQGYRVCDDGHGYQSTEWLWQGVIVGSDSDGNHWTSSRWRDGVITIGAPSGR
jgi:hypothetical protein